MFQERIAIKILQAATTGRRPRRIPKETKEQVSIVPKLKKHPKGGGSQHVENSRGVGAGTGQDYS